MTDGFLRVASITPKVKVGDVKGNIDEIITNINKVANENVGLVVFPELCISGYTCGDLFYQDIVIKSSLNALKALCDATNNDKIKNILIFVGLPFRHGNTLYNAAACVCGGKVLGFVPKTFIPNYSEFYEARYFGAGEPDMGEIILPWQEESVPFGTDIIFANSSMPDCKVACEICEDLWVANPPSGRHASAGATIIVNLSASNELVGKGDYRLSLVRNQSARLYSAYVYASAGTGESTTDVVYSGHRIICENGIVLESSLKFSEGCTISDIDLQAIIARRKNMSTYANMDKGYRTVCYDAPVNGYDKLRRFVDPHPFVPDNPDTLVARCEEILAIQANGLAKRLSHTHSDTVVVGISGGLDSTLALLVCSVAYDLLGLDRKGIIAITMPGFGTTDRTYDNACEMVKTIGATLREIPISNAVKVHFSDIGQDENVLDVTYENSQARERTQILMDVANKENGLVVGTGDLSELALGWATYNGDHMSMYGVNASVPKTLVRHLVKYYADNRCEETLKKVLYDVLDTPVSPELLPPKDGNISQKTEDLVGPYELHDFFLYYMVRYAFAPSKIKRLANIAFAGEYDADTIEKWLKTFYRRFFSQQFKRSALPDGPKVGTVALSPRGDWRMPSDAVSDLWICDI